ncbi:chemotaxis protein CheC [Bacillus pakistanensis]|uniref:Chemotaxis protein CheC n=1 Tax=Rossellomorea pakistanensis TaxID=992288 RepID=A0ABS2NGA3_9BACI|nr:chemotaxis protein CheC [Bacillus pakistanensis]MBM7586855.1 chemotaxis protein CheC [Bacillus pakistanensis]
MSYEEKISPIHLDLLKEIGNIGAGNAATALSKLMNQKVDMKVPSVRIVSFNEMMDLAGGTENVVLSIFLRVDGDAPGSMFFVLPLEQASFFAQRMIGDKTITFEEPPYSEIGLSAMQELGNILSGSYLSALSDFTNIHLYPSVPELSIDMVGAIISYGLVKVSQVSDYVIVIDTALREENLPNSESVNGHFFLLPDPDSFQTIFKTLGVI